MKRLLRTVLTWIELKNGHQMQIQLPAIKVVCCRCDGTGIHDHPNVTGFSIDDLNDDPEFKSAYFAGNYDVNCEVCAGERVILEVDREALSSKMLRRLERAENTRHRDEQEAAAELKWGC